MEGAESKKPVGGMLMESNVGKKIINMLLVLFLIMFFVGAASAAPITNIAITSPNGGEEWSGTQNIVWTIIGDGNVDIVYTIDNWANSISVVPDYNGNLLSYAWDTSAVSDGVSYQVRIYKDGDPTVYGTSSAVFKIDNTDPVTTLTNPCGDIWNDSNQTIEFDTADDLSDINRIVVTIDGEDVHTFTDSNYASYLLSTDANHLINYYAVDMSGNVEADRNFYCAIDQTAPTLGGYANWISWNNEDGNIWFMSMGFGVSGVASGQYSIDGGDLTSFDFTESSGTDRNYAITMTEDGNYLIDGVFTDNAGNVLTITEKFFGLDTVAPVTTLTSTCGTDWNNSASQDIILQATDATSGINTIIYTVDGGNTYVVSANPLTYTTFVDGNHLINYYSTDVAGNAEVDRNFYCAIDHTAPTVTAGTDIDTNTLPIALDATTSDSNSGIASHLWTQVSGPGIITLDDNSIVDPTISGVSVEGVYVLSLTVIDNADNNTTDTITVIYETTAPVTTADFNTTTWVNEIPMINFTCTDNNSGCDTVFYTVNVETYADNNVDNGVAIFPATPGWIDGNNEITFRAFDEAGNYEELNTLYVLVDRNAPITDGNITSGTEGSNSWYTTDVNFTLYPTDLNSGIASTVYCISSTDTCTPATAYTTPIVVSAAGNNYVRFRSTDVAGNVQAIQSSGLIKIDQVHPTIVSATADSNPSPAGTVTITVEFSEDMDETTDLNVVVMGDFNNAPFTISGSFTDENTWAGTFDLNDYNEKGTATISVTDANDLAGNVMVANLAAGTFLINTRYEFEFPKSGNGFNGNQYFGDLISRLELSSISEWDANMTMSSFLSANAGPDAEMMESSLAANVYIYNTANGWTTVADENFDSYNLYDELESLNYFVFDLENDAFGRSIRHQKPTLRV